VQAEPSSPTSPSGNGQYAVLTSVGVLSGPPVPGTLHLLQTWRCWTSRFPAPPSSRSARLRISLTLRLYAQLLVAAGFRSRAILAERPDLLAIRDRAPPGAERRGSGREEEDGEILLIDAVLTPDSSRYWQVR
jgi:hypothetical protein